MVRQGSKPQTGMTRHCVILPHRRECSVAVDSHRGTEISHSSSPVDGCFFDLYAKKVIQATQLGDKISHQSVRDSSTLELGCRAVIWMG
jgi:hypothetical protein